MEIYVGQRLEEERFCLHKGWIEDGLTPRTHARLNGAYSKTPTCWARVRAVPTPPVPSSQHFSRQVETQIGSELAPGLTGQQPPGGVLPQPSTLEEGQGRQWSSILEAQTQKRVPELESHYLNSQEMDKRAWRPVDSKKKREQTLTSQQN